MTNPPRLGSCVLPALTTDLDSLWDAVLDLAEDLDPNGWVLVGGQMVMLHGLAARRVATRASKDIDMLADLLTSSGAVGECVRAVLRLGFEPLESNERGLLHRFIRPADQAVVDVLAPDHAPPRWRPTTIPPKTTMKIDGGRQALERAVLIEVTKAGRTVDVPVPSPLGALILKGAAYRADSRDRDRHAYDAAFLASLITDPIATRDSLKGSDRKRLRALDEVLTAPDHEVWALLGEAREDAITRWRLLLA
ncbi:nucleotidyl transferase AbiEii/AbiGii toxin family protein [Kribbella sp. NPDC050820]|uniref:nucleotidyl transferase AbiEii/AbiGii toxin family protein n=1 Tax=Kribbella sp. NPDC050820 TaxID=3155408 RepID=UPI0033D5FDF9